MNCSEHEDAQWLPCQRKRARKEARVIYSALTGDSLVKQSCVNKPNKYIDPQCTIAAISIVSLADACFEYLPRKLSSQRL